MSGKKRESTAIKGLSIQGGGPKGVCYLGALGPLEKHGVLASVEVTCGSSAGAITAFLCAMGFTAKQIKELSLSINFTDILEERDSLFGNQVMPLPIHLIEGIIDRGAYSSDNALNFIKKILYLVTGDPNITFEELAKLRERSPWIKNFICTIGIYWESQDEALRLTEPTASRDNPTIYCSALNPRTKDILVADAVIGSMSLPVVYKPKAIHKKVEGRLIKVAEAYDGGVENNNPIDYLSKAITQFVPETIKYQQTNAAGDEIINSAVLGLSLADTKQLDAKITPFTDFIKDTVTEYHRSSEPHPAATEAVNLLITEGTQLLQPIHTLLRAQKGTTLRITEDLPRKLAIHKDRIIQLWNHDVGTTEFTVGQEKKDMMIQESKHTVELWFETKGKDLKKVKTKDNSLRLIGANKSNEAFANMMDENKEVAMLLQHIIKPAQYFDQTIFVALFQGMLSKNIEILHRHPELLEAAIKSGNSDALEIMLSITQKNINTRLQHDQPVNSNLLSNIMVAGENPLFLQAIESEDLLIIQTMVKYGANINSTMLNGQTFIEYILKNNKLSSFYNVMLAHRFARKTGEEERILLLSKIEAIAPLTDTAKKMKDIVNRVYSMGSIVTNLPLNMLTGTLGIAKSAANVIERLGDAFETMTSIPVSPLKYSIETTLKPVDLSIKLIDSINNLIIHDTLKQPMSKALNLLSAYSIDTVSAYKLNEPIDSEGNTILHLLYSLSREDYEKVFANIPPWLPPLLQHNKPNIFGITPEEIAVNNRILPFNRRIQSSFNDKLSHKDNNKHIFEYQLNTAFATNDLHIACFSLLQSQDPNIVKLILRYRLDDALPFNPEYAGLNILGVAIKNNWTDVVDAYLNLLVNTKNSDNLIFEILTSRYQDQTLLHHAVSQKDGGSEYATKILKMANKYKINLNINDSGPMIKIDTKMEFRESAIVKAASNGHFELLDNLLQSPTTDRHTHDAVMKNCLHHLCLNGDANQVINFLNRHGKYSNSLFDEKDLYGKTPFHYLMENKFYQEILQGLENHSVAYIPDFITSIAIDAPIKAYQQLNQIMPEVPIVQMTKNSILGTAAHAVLKKGAATAYHHLGKKWFLEDWCNVLHEVRAFRNFNENPINSGMLTPLEYATYKYGEEKVEQDLIRFCSPEFQHNYHTIFKTKIAATVAEFHNNANYHNQLNQVDLALVAPTEYSSVVASSPEDYSSEASSSSSTNPLNVIRTFSDPNYSSNHLYEHLINQNNFDNLKKELMKVDFTKLIQKLDKQQLINLFIKIHDLGKPIVHKKLQDIGSAVANPLNQLANKGALQANNLVWLFTPTPISNIAKDAKDQLTSAGKLVAANVNKQFLERRYLDDCLTELELKLQAISAKYDKKFVDKLVLEYCSPEFNKKRQLPDHPNSTSSRGNH